jgi:hypothetical protein
MKTVLVRWIVANAVGWCCAMIVYGLLDGGMRSPWPAGTVGIVIGTAQWLVLRRDVSYWWILGTAVAWSLGTWAGFAKYILGPDALYAGGIGGVLAGVVQYPLLQGRISHPWIWVGASVVASIAGWFAGVVIGVICYSHGFSYVQAEAVGGLPLGLVAGSVERTGKSK